jgi:phage gp37-like protein
MIAAIELGILARLKAVSDSDALGYKYRTLETYPEDWDEYLKDKDAINAPAAWAVFAGARAIEGTSTSPIMRLTFGVVFMAENMRNETATRHGGPVSGEPGSYQLAEDGFLILVGSDLGLPIGAFDFQSIRLVSRFPALNERKVSMVAIELTTDVQASVETPGDELPPFELFHANWDIPPHGNVDGDSETPGIQIPADDTADATDDVHLEQPS